MLIDTVGLLRHACPTTWWEAFKIHVGAGRYGEISSLNVCDASSEEAGGASGSDQRAAAGAGQRGPAPVIPVLNKWDAVEDRTLAVRVQGAVSTAPLRERVWRNC